MSQSGHPNRCTGLVDRLTWSCGTVKDFWECYQTSRTTRGHQQKPSRLRRLQYQVCITHTASFLRAVPTGRVSILCNVSRPQTLLSEDNNVVLAVSSAYYCGIHVRPHSVETTENMLDKAPRCFMLMDKNKSIVIGGDFDSRLDKSSDA